MTDKKDNVVIMKKPICAKIITTMDNDRRPCLREEGHEGGCNPYSANKPLIPKEVK